MSTGASDNAAGERGLREAIEALAAASLREGRGGTWVHDGWFAALLNAATPDADDASERGCCSGRSPWHPEHLPAPTPDDARTIRVELVAPPVPGCVCEAMDYESAGPCRVPGHDSRAASTGASEPGGAQ